MSFQRMGWGKLAPSYSRDKESQWLCPGPECPLPKALLCSALHVAPPEVLTVRPSH